MAMEVMKKKIDETDWLCEHRNIRGVCLCLCLSGCQSIFDSCCRAGWEQTCLYSNVMMLYINLCQPSYYTPECVIPWWCGVFCWSCKGGFSLMDLMYSFHLSSDVPLEWRRVVNYWATIDLGALGCPLCVWCWGGGHLYDSVCISWRVCLDKVFTVWYLPQTASAWDALIPDTP